jgi:hypothetical protein
MFSSSKWSFGIIKHILDMFEKNLWPHHDFDLSIIYEIYTCFPDFSI